MNYESYTEQDSEKGHQYLFTVRCPQCQETEVITVNGPDLFEYNQGTKAVQLCFPYLTASQRERLFMSGICDPCWQEMFGDEEG